MKTSQKSALLLTSLLLLTACGQEEQTASKEVVRPVKAVKIVPVAATHTAAYPAVILPAQKAELSFRSSGEVIELPVKAGDQVEEDDVIAQLDTKDLAPQVTSLESQLEQARAQLDALTAGARSEDIAALKANIAAAEAQLDVAREQLARTNQLFEKKLAARAKVQSDESNVRVAEAKLEATRQELIKGQAGGRKEEVAAQLAVIKGIEANLTQARTNLTDATLRAPFDGIVARRDVDNFTNVQAKQTIAIIQKLDNLEVSFDIPGPDIARADELNLPKITVRLDAVPNKEFPAKIMEFNTIANNATQTFTGRVSIEQPKEAIILPGMTGQVLIHANNPNANQISIPGTALASDPDGSIYLWVVAGGKVSKRSVVTGMPHGALILIKEGLKAGEVVVTGGVSFLQDGMQVRARLEGE